MSKSFTCKPNDSQKNHAMALGFCMIKLVAD